MNLWGFGKQGETIFPGCLKKKEGKETVIFKKQSAPPFVISH